MSASRIAGAPPTDDGWRTIDSAPKDGTRVLLFRNGYKVFGKWDDDRYAAKPRGYWSHDRVQQLGVKDARAVPPSHWMPMPGDPPPPAGDAP